MTKRGAAVVCTFAAPVVPLRPLGGIRKWTAPYYIDSRIGIIGSRDSGRDCRVRTAAGGGTFDVVARGTGGSRPVKRHLTGARVAPKTGRRERQRRGDTHVVDENRVVACTRAHKCERVTGRCGGERGAVSLVGGGRGSRGEAGKGRAVQRQVPCLVLADAADTRWAAEKVTV